ncbi:hypothetical protein GCM10027293_10330 [Pontibacter aydingkolensis]
MDLDLDGKPDVISASNSGGLTIARNLSTPGSLNFVAHNFAGAGGNSIALADFDGDGRVDIVSPNRISRNISTGPGNINFQFFSSFGGYQVAAGDFNSDGKIDILAQDGSNNIILYRNTSTGPGAISFVQAFLMNVGHRNNGVQIGDVDGDGKVDIMASQGNGNRMISLRNTTPVNATSFAFEPYESWPSNGVYPYRAMIADFDKDGKIDFTTPNYGHGSSDPAQTNTAIFRNTSVVGDISFAPSVNLPAPVNNYRIGVGDVNGDGFPDIVTKSLGVNVFSVYPNISTGPGNAAFSSRIDYTSSAQAEVSGIVIGDLDGDFVPDIATSGISSNTIRFHRNTSAQADITPPTVVCKNITVALTPSGTVKVTPEMIDNGSGDACGIANMEVNGAASVDFTCSDIGVNRVTLKVIDKAGNASTCTATVTVAPAAIIVAGQTTVCKGQTVALSANQGDSYQWYKDGTIINGEINQSYTATESGNYTVAVTNSGGCSGVSAATAVTVNDNPTVTTFPTGNASICSGGKVTITASESSVYQWYINNNPISGANQRTYSATTAGTYTVSVIDLFGCSAISDPIIVDATDDINPIAKVKNITIALDANESATVTAADIDDGSYDNCSTISLSLSQSTFSCSDVGKVIPVTLTVTDGNNNVSSAIAQVTVTDPNSYCNSTPVAVGREITVQADENCQGTAEAIMFDGGSTDEDGDELTFSVAPAGPYILGLTSVVLTVRDSKGAISTTNASVTVKDETKPVLSTAPADIIVYTGSSATSCTATATWTTLTATDNCGGVTVSSNFEPGIEFPIGTTTVTYTAVDGAGNKSEKSFTVTVVDNTNPTLTAPAAIVRNTDAGKCDAEISNLGSPVFGDNCAGATVSNNAPTVFPKGTTTVIWTVTDAAGNTATATQTVTVEDKENPVITTLQNITKANDDSECGAVVTFTGPTATDNCSDVIVTQTDNTDLTSGSTFPVGTTLLEYTATDAAGNTAVTTFSVTVTNAVPAIDLVSATTDPIAVNTSINLGVAYTDNNITNAAINWGDNSGVQNIPNPANNFAVSHTYNAAGVYTVKVILTDACLATSNEYVYQYVVVYDSDGGFVTGGGWIDSPKGAYKADDAMGGKAHFGFVSKYQKGANVPSGKTNFEFKTAELDFQSTSYEWLVISGATARFKGEGTINGSGWYGFILAATDGQVNGGGGTDKFRIKIWDKNNNDIIIYDNNLEVGNGDDDANAETAIMGGSIVVHEGMKGKSTSSVVSAGAIEPEPLKVNFYSYPTAFSAKTTIAFSLEKEEEYVLEVFDMKGALVKKLASGNAEAKKLYKYELKSDGMAEGVYITRLTTTSSVRSIKAVLKR